MDLRVPVRQAKTSKVRAAQTHVIPEVSPFPDVDRLLEFDCRSVIRAITLVSACMEAGRLAYRIICGTCCEILLMGPSPRPYIQEGAIMYASISFLRRRELKSATPK
jgi:hypothetical protein